MVSCYKSLILLAVFKERKINNPEKFVHTLVDEIIFSADIEPEPAYNVVYLTALICHNKDNIDRRKTKCVFHPGLFSIIEKFCNRRLQSFRVSSHPDEAACTHFFRGINCSIKVFPGKCFPPKHN